MRFLLITFNELNNHNYYRLLHLDKYFKKYLITKSLIPQIGSTNCFWKLIFLCFKLEAVLCE